MPLSPTPAQSEASRANGALSRGPATDAGKARSAANAPVPSHGLRGAGPFALLPGEDPAEFRALLADLLATHAPAGAAERHWVEEIAHATWRRRRLLALEALVVERLLGGEPPAADAAPLPSFATLVRYAGRLERDLRLAHAELARLREERLARAQERTPEPGPFRAATKPTPRPEMPVEPVTPEPGPQARAEPGPQARAEPGRPAPNRAQRRRLAALARARQAA